VSASAGPSIAIVVPVRNEADGLEASLRRILDAFPECDLVVVDGDSTDGSATVARRWARQVIVRAPGRAAQMNAGAAATSAEVLWFVHADCRLPADATAQIRRAMTNPDVVGGGLRLAFDRRGAGLDWLAVTSNLRARHLHWVFGDQAMFVRRSVFDSVGGFPDLPLMEDLELSRRLARRGRLVVVPATVTASARRLANQPWRMNVFMQWLKLLYFLGVDPEAIRARYDEGPRRLRGRRSREGTRRR
jgi:rSAM/selenodomain-associated transferase 2